MESKIRVLIIEDVDAMRALLEWVLKDEPGIEISGLARNGAEARLELGRHKPDLVLLDEILPGESSLDLLELIKAQDIPVLLITGMERAAHPLPPGALGRLEKPDWDTLNKDQARFRTAILQAVRKSSS